jgi:16S rRNA (guanine966-N2)-methyltransferase
VIRIVAGEFRGRRLAVGPGVRPTTERAREALFSILGGSVRGAKVLDAAAGSGALGFEALSRGAREACFVEADRRVARVLEENAVRTGLERRVRVFGGTVATFVRVERPSGYDVVFFDPPWADPVAAELGGLWAALAERGTFVVERGSGKEPWPEAPVEPDVRNYGRTTLFIYRRPGRGPAGAVAALEPGRGSSRGEEPEPVTAIDPPASRK